MIKKIKIENYLGRYNHEFYFHEDINIITGHNGCGKTTLLLIMWGLIRGNLQFFRDGLFSKLELETINEISTIDTVEGQPSYSYQPTIASLPINDDLEPTGTGTLGEIFKKIIHIIDSDSASNNEVYAKNISKIPVLFFPTYRRIESLLLITGVKSENLEQILKFLAGALSATQRGRHKVVFSVSGKDIEELLPTQAEFAASQGQNFALNFANCTKEILDSEISDEEKLKQIKDLRSQTDDSTNECWSSIKEFHQAVISFFSNKGIRLGNNQIIGNQDDAVDISSLSSGEKQLLGFLAYAIFFKNTVFFIDEPELSLHPDWQRKLIPTFRKVAAKNKNQFFLVTHSPFIYAANSDYEFILDENKGGK